jgi:hypothetical protein
MERTFVEGPPDAEIAKIMKKHASGGLRTHDLAVQLALNDLGENG